VHLFDIRPIDGRLLSFCVAGSPPVTTAILLMAGENAQGTQSTIACPVKSIARC